MENKIEILTQILKDSNNIVFFEVLELVQNLEYLILEVLMVYLMKNLI